MIAKGNFHAHGGKLAAYMTKGKAGERAELVEMRGFAANDLRTAFRDIEIEQRGTNAKTAFFHAYVRLPEGERLDTGQWTKTADRIEKRLGFTGQARAIAFHTDIETGERHMHIAWSRIARNPDGNLFAIDPGLYKNKLKEISRELERELGLTRVSNERAPNNRARSADRREFEESRRLGTNINAVRAAILDSFQKSDSGKSFAAAIQAQGFDLAQGDRRDCFVIVDHAGGQHALNKKLTGKTLAEIRQRLGDLDRARLPTVDQAKDIQATRQVERGERQERSQTRDMAAEIRPSTETAQWHTAAQEAVQRPQRSAASETRAGQQRASQAHENAPAAASASGPEITRSTGRAVGGIFGGLARMAESVLGGLFSLFAGDEPKPTPQQVHDKAQAAGNAETQHAQAHEAAQREKDERLKELLDQIRRDDNDRRAAPEYFRPITRGSDQDYRDRDNDYGRERERER